MPRDFFDPPLDETNILNVSAATLRKAEALIIDCEARSEDRGVCPRSDYWPGPAVTD